MQKTITTLYLQFKLSLPPPQIPQWRGAVIESAGIEQDILHNHHNEKLWVVPSPLKEYVEEKLTRKEIQTQTKPLAIHAELRQEQTKLYNRYPLVHYRSEKGNAAIFAMGKGTKIIRRWVLQKTDNFMLRGRKYNLLIKNLSENQFNLRLSTKLHTYRLLDYIALNERNHQRWQKADRLSKRIQILEEVLTGHILAFAEGANWQIPAHIEVQLLNLKAMRKVKMHKMDRIAFNLLFRSNVILPSRIALGRSVAFGFGVVQPVKKDL